MNIYAFPLPGDPVIRPETRAEMIDRMAAEALEWVRKTCAEISAEYEQQGTEIPPSFAAALASENRIRWNDLARAGGTAWADRHRTALLNMAASSHPWYKDAELAQRSALAQFHLAQLQNVL